MRRSWILLPLCLTGCVERLLTIKSEPPGAEVLVDGEKAGVTPCDVPYAWYGTRSVTLERPHTSSVTHLVPLSPPWWQIFPLDFVTDIILPFTLTDRTELHFLLQAEPTEPVDEQELKRRAGELRAKTREP